LMCELWAHRSRTRIFIFDFSSFFLSFPRNAPGF
jgi:hypothetical protein